MVEDRGRGAEHSSGQRGKRVAESIAADALQINTKVSQKAVELRDGSRPAGARQPHPRVWSY